jgi:hypothetical protein
MVLEKPRLLFQATVDRRRYSKRFFWSLLGAVAAAGAGVALTYAYDRGALDNRTILLVGQIVAGVVTVLSLLRAVVALLLWIRRRNETVKFYDKGFVWQRGKDEYKYSWNQIAAFREGVHDIVIRGKPMWQRGAHTLTMRDGKVFRVTSAHGNTRQFAKAVRRYIADVTGTRMGQALRNMKTITIHPQLTVTPVGINMGKKNKISWEELDIAVKGGKLRLYRLNPKGKFKQVKSYDTHQVDNLGGFVEIATSTIKNHQPERFNIRTQGPARRGY